MTSLIFSCAAFTSERDSEQNARMKLENIFQITLLLFTWRIEVVVLLYYETSSFSVCFRYTIICR